MGLDSNEHLREHTLTNAHAERGFTTAENVVITFICLVVVTFTVNLLVGLYAQGVVRAASNDAARAAARAVEADHAGRVHICEEKFDQVASGLLRADTYHVECESTVDRVTVRVDGDFPWFADFGITDGISLDTDVTYRRRVGSDRQ